MSEQSPAQPSTPPSSPGSSAGSPSKEECNMAMLIYILAIVTNFVGPLIIWLLKKDQSAFINDQGKEVLNFQLTILMAMIGVSIIGCLTLGLGMILAPIIMIISLVFCIMGAIAASKGTAYRFPVAIRLLK